MEPYSMEIREVMALKAAIEILKDIKQAADKGMLWRDPAHFSEEYRRSYESLISKFIGVAIYALEGLVQKEAHHGKAPTDQSL